MAVALVGLHRQECLWHWKMDLKTNDFDYELPPELIAQHPLPERDASRMMVVDRTAGTVVHRQFLDLPDYLNAGDLLVLNDTRVIPARLFGERKGTGGKVELLLVEEGGNELPTSNANVWVALCRAGWKPRAGIRLSLGGGRIEGVIVGVGDEGKVNVRLSADGPLMEALEECGAVPLPPYIRRHGAESRGHGAGDDRERYQTIYADEPGAVAAPTAGLHFTDAMFERLESRGVRRTRITLHVGPGTFRPVKTDEIAEHTMEEERYQVSEEAAGAVNGAKLDGNRVIAVGSTSVRTLETVAVRDDGGTASQPSVDVRSGRSPTLQVRRTVQPGNGRSGLFIYPPFEFKVVDAMLTNFHLPKSTLIMMVSAFAGLDLTRYAYREAVKEKYRFYSYGDCMLVV